MRIGQKEDADFTFRVMVVQVLWPGATVAEMQDQVVDKIERKLQEVPGLDFVRSYTRSGFANIFVNLKGSMRGEAVKDAWYQARKKVGDIRQTFPEGVIGPYFNDTNSAIPTFRSMHSRAGTLPIRSSRLSPSARATFCCAFPASQKWISWGHRT